MRSKAQTLITTLFLAGAISVFFASAATAGVVVDPNGPASKQYSADLDRARQQGSGSSGDAGVPGSSSKAPLFGAGVTPTGSGARKAGDQPGSATGAPTALDAGSGTVLTIVGICALVLLAGGMGAFAIRRGLAQRTG